MACSDAGTSLTTMSWPSMESTDVTRLLNERMAALRHDILQTLREVSQDSVLKQMSLDDSSAQHLELRVIELLDTSLQSEQERYNRRLLHRVAHQAAQIAALQHQLAHAHTQSVVHHESDQLYSTILEDKQRLHEEQEHLKGQVHALQERSSSLLSQCQQLEVERARLLQKVTAQDRTLAEMRESFEQQQWQTMLSSAVSTADSTTSVYFPSTPALPQSSGWPAVADISSISLPASLSGKYEWLRVQLQHIKNQAITHATGYLRNVLTLATTAVGKCSKANFDQPFEAAQQLIEILLVEMFASLADMCSLDVTLSRDATTLKQLSRDSAMRWTTLLREKKASHRGLKHLLRQREDQLRQLQATLKQREETLSREHQEALETLRREMERQSNATASARSELQAQHELAVQVLQQHAATLQQKLVDMQQQLQMQHQQMQSLQLQHSLTQRLEQFKEEFSFSRQQQEQSRINADSQLLRSSIPPVNAAEVAAKAAHEAVAHVERFTISRAEHLETIRQLETKFVSETREILAAGDRHLQQQLMEIETRHRREADTAVLRMQDEISRLQAALHAQQQVSQTAVAELKAARTELEEEKRAGAGRTHRHSGRMQQLARRCVVDAAFVGKASVRLRSDVQHQFLQLRDACEGLLTSISGEYQRRITDLHHTLAVDSQSKQTQREWTTRVLAALCGVLIHHFPNQPMQLCQSLVAEIVQPGNEACLGQFTTALGQGLRLVIEDLTQRLRAAENHSREVEEALQQQREGRRAASHQFDRQRSDLLAQVAALRQEISALTEREVKAAEDWKAALATADELSKKHQDELRRQREENTITVTALRAAFQTAKDENVALGKRLAEAQSCFADAERKVQGLSEKLAAATLQINASEATCDNLKGIVQDRETKSNALQSQFAELETTAAVVEQQRARDQQELRSLRSQLKDTLQKLRECEQQNAALHSKCLARESELVRVGHTRTVVETNA
eukprot:TRINITY_DN10267_c0_g1_i1.p1 TRINITY_DN10267_c0_g1~~TRINITY_DN10267_c0_g1_i1.p1  ORF type:complete len:987 (+),score=222.10 TRINITY_DN10267_c0_g1_i1:35-2962(+)